MRSDSKNHMDVLIRIILRFDQQRDEQRLKDLEYQRLLSLKHEQRPKIFKSQCD